MRPATTLPKNLRLVTSIHGKVQTLSTSTELQSRTDLQQEDVPRSSSSQINEKTRWTGRIRRLYHRYAAYSTALVVAEALTCWIIGQNEHVAATQ